MHKLLSFILITFLLSPTLSPAQPGTRWYSYGQYLANASTVDTSAIYLWNDTTARFGYTASGAPVYYNNSFTSAGMSFAPVLDAWNDVAQYGSGIKVGPADAYIIDSVRINGIYSRNPAKTIPNDTLLLSFVYGNGSFTTNLPHYYFTGLGATYGYDTVGFIELLHDSVKNIAGAYPGVLTTPYVQKIVLTAVDTSNTFTRVIYLTTPFAVPAGKCAAMSITFKSGDPAYTPLDTVRYASGAYKYSEFEPMVEFAGSLGLAFYPPYNSVDSNVGYFKSQGAAYNDWRGFYIPTWAWGSSAAPSALQYPVIDFHISCATCMLADTIAGPKAVCITDTAALTFSIAGGTWSSSNTGVATIGATTGVVTGLAMGTTNITYFASGSYATSVFTVNIAPVAGSITGPASLCVGANSTLLDTAAGGAWNSSGGAIIDPSSGFITGTSAGTAVISYGVTNACTTAYTFDTITINPYPYIGIISGPDSICIGDTTYFADTSVGGLWSALNTDATISASGTLIGMSAGLDIISYSVNTVHCGVLFASQLIAISDCSAAEVHNIPGMNENFSLYPNPAGSSITVTAPAPLSTIVISDLMGRKVLEAANNTCKATISLEHLQPGVYMVKINGNKVYKLVRQ